jgi:dTDP-glucose 4,6-dehydratase
MKVLVTGGSGFIGTNLVRHILARTDWDVVNVDALRHALSGDVNAEIAERARYTLECIDLRDRDAVQDIFERHQPELVFHLAAETHVDRSISDGGAFVASNVTGTFNALEALRATGRMKQVKWIHVSTDEVFGSGEDGISFTEGSVYRPSSPYSASKAGADHLVEAWMRTYGLRAIIVYPSNNYGPYQWPEKLVPTVISRAVRDLPIPLYGDGMHRRNWLYVEDHVESLVTIACEGCEGQRYAVGGDEEQPNIRVVRQLCSELDRMRGRESGAHAALIQFVADRAGHDLSYPLDSSKVRAELGWAPRVRLEEGVQRTVEWYLNRPEWAFDVSWPCTGTETAESHATHARAGRYSDGGEGTA